MTAIDPFIFDRLLAQRIVCVGTDIDDDLANAVIAQLLYLESEDRTRDVTLYLSSPGGVVTSALAIHDTMTSIAPPVATLAIREAGGVAAVLLAAGRRGKRSALPNARIGLLPLEAGSAEGGSPEITAREMRRLSAILRELLSRHTRMGISTIEAAMERRTWMTADEARDFGIIDAIAEPPVGPFHLPTRPWWKLW